MSHVDTWDLYEELITAIRAEIPGVETVVGNNRTKRYAILKYAGKTIGYINGRTKLRIDAPGLERKCLVVSRYQIPTAVEFVRGYLKEDQ